MKRRANPDVASGPPFAACTASKYSTVRNGVTTGSDQPWINDQLSAASLELAEIRLLRIVELRHVRERSRVAIEVEVARVVALAPIVREGHVAEEVACEERYQRQIACARRTREPCRPIRLRATRHAAWIELRALRVACAAVPFLEHRDFFGLETRGTRFGPGFDTAARFGSSLRAIFSRGAGERGWLPVATPGIVDQPIVRAVE
jgi:hypothetical protein